MPFSLRHDDASPSPITQTLEAWGIEGLSLRESSLEASTLEFRVVCDFDAPPLFAYGDKITLLDGETVIYKGRIRQLPAQAGDQQESQSYVAEDVIGDLARRAYAQTWNIYNGETTTPTPSPLLVLFRDSEGAPVTVSAQLAAIIADAAAAGIEVQAGTMAGMLINPFAQKAAGVTYLEAIKEALRFVPDCCSCVDYSTSPPTLNFIRRVHALEKTLNVEDLESFVIEPLHDQQINAVVLTYHKQSAYEGQNFPDIFQDRYPAESTGNEENALIAVTELTPPTASQSIQQEQYIETELINPESFSFWEKLWPEIADRNEAATLTDGELSNNTIKRMIVNGAQPAWTGAAETITVKAVFNGILNGSEIYVGKKLEARVNCSNLATGTFSQFTPGESYDPGETPPTGIAQALHSALNPLQYKGAAMTVQEEVTFTEKVGDVLNFTGSTAAEHATARAQVQQITRDFDTGTVTRNFGPAAWLAFDDLLELLRATRAAQPSINADARAGNAGGGVLPVTGGGMGPGASLIPTETEKLHPFKVSRITGDLFRIESGQIDGVAVPTQNLDVGAARPVSVRLWPEFNVTVFNNEYVSAASIKPTPAPLVQSHASPNDVTLISSAGDESRCVLAVIDAANLVTQYATKNITTLIEPDGLLQGDAIVQFNKA